MRRIGVKGFQCGRQAYFSWRSLEINFLYVDYNLDLGYVSCTLLGFWISFWWKEL